VEKPQKRSDGWENGPATQEEINALAKQEAGARKTGIPWGRKRADATHQQPVAETEKRGMEKSHQRSKRRDKPITSKRVKKGRGDGQRHTDPLVGNEDASKNKGAPAEENDGQKKPPREKREQH